MKEAFTMIELIFVIVIIGILSAVAIPKMNSMSISAKQANIESFVSILNSTVGPTMWRKSLKETVVTDRGDVTKAGYCDKLKPDYFTELPAEITAFGADCKITVDTEIASATDTVIFNPGNTLEAPSWTIDKTKYK